MRLLLLLTLAIVFARPGYGASDLRFSAMERGDLVIARLSEQICHYDRAETISHVLSFTKPGPSVVVSIQETSHPLLRELGVLTLTPAEVASLDRALLACRTAKPPSTSRGDTIALTFVESGSVMLQESLNSSLAPGAGTITFQDLIARCEKETKPGATIPQK